jgi:hypothetical protein
VDTFARGAAVAAVLAGAWRRSPPPPDLDDVSEVVPMLVRGGAAGLAWHRLRAGPLCKTFACRELRQHYRMQALRAVDYAAAVAEVLSRVRAAGVEPILIKGWSSARLYPEPGLRPSDDVDLCVPEDRLADALGALSGPLPCAGDLHGGVPDLPDRTWGEAFGRSRLVAGPGGAEVRVLGAEDQLRLLCLHLARHGVARPLWLCDVGACLEGLPEGFDWDYCLRGRPSLSAWAASVMGLACRLLGAKAASDCADRCPAWVERAVLWCWGAGPERSFWRRLIEPREAMRRLSHHGISPGHGSAPIKDAFRLGLDPRRLRVPSLLLQVVAFVRRKGPYLWRLFRPKRRPPGRLLGPRVGIHRS